MWVRNEVQFLILLFMLATWWPLQVLVRACKITTPFFTLNPWLADSSSGQAVTSTPLLLLNHILKAADYQIRALYRKCQPRDHINHLLQSNAIYHQTRKGKWRRIQTWIYKKFLLALRMNWLVLCASTDLSTSVMFFWYRRQMLWHLVCFPHALLVSITNDVRQCCFTCC